MTQPEDDFKRPPLTDLRSITEDSDRLITTVTIFMTWDRASAFKWLVCGESRLRRAVESSHDSSYCLEAFLGRGVTDSAHDTGLAFRLPLFGLVFDRVNHHMSRFTACVDPNADKESFHVPYAGYDPSKHFGAKPCTDKGCKDKPHMILPSGFYVPPFIPELFDLVRGKKVEILIGHVARKDD